MGDSEQSGLSQQGQQFLKIVREGRSFSGRERHCLFFNSGEQFYDISAVSGFDLPDDGRALAQTDWDHDGDPDYWISNRNGPQIRFLRNGSRNENHFVAFQLQGTKSNRDGIGARIQVYLHDNSKPILRSLRAGDAFLSQSSKTIHFGLGKRDTIERVEVRWPSGIKQELTIPQVDRVYRILEGNDQIQPVKYVARSVPSISKTDNQEPPAQHAPRAMCFSMIALPLNEYQSFDGESKLLTLPKSKTLVNLWASWCPSCLQELTEIKEQNQRLRNHGIDVLALSVDSLGNDGSRSSNADQEFLQSLEFPFRYGRIDEKGIAKLQMLNDTIFELHDPLPVPTSFLLDKNRRVVAVFKGEVSVDEIVTTSKKLKANTTEEWRMRTVPFPGRWIMPPRRRHLFEYANDLADQGFTEAAIDYVKRNQNMFVNHPRWKELEAKLR